MTVVTLSHLGYFEWKTWVATFTEVEQETAHDAYYRQWLSCLEKILDETQLVLLADVAKRTAPSAFRRHPGPAAMV